MNQEFFINAKSVNPVLRMELINDGRYDFNSFYDAIQDATVTFSMVDSETGILKVSKAKADVKLIYDTGCEERYAIEYAWKERDTATPGIYQGWFDIKFNGNISQDGVDYPTGNLKVPIIEDLIIYVK